MRLRSIPPRVSLKRPAATREWTPHVLPHRQPQPASQLRQSMPALIQQRIDALSQEITSWLPEFGETALMALYEEQARWALISTALLRDFNN